MCQTISQRGAVTSWSLCAKLSSMILEWYPSSHVTPRKRANTCISRNVKPFFNLCWFSAMEFWLVSCLCTQSRFTLMDVDLYWLSWYLLRAHWQISALWALRNKNSQPGHISTPHLEFSSVFTHSHFCLTSTSPVSQEMLSIMDNSKRSHYAHTKNVSVFMKWKHSLSLTLTIPQFTCADMA